MPLYADLCVRLQNASRAKLRSVPIPNTKANLSITSILLQHGFIYNVTRGTIAGPSAADYNAAPEVRRRLWVDLKYRADDRPVLEKMNLVSKPSRQLSMTNDELLRWVTGRRAKFVSPLRAGEIGIINCGKDGWFEAKEAMRRKLEGEVVCRVS
ncbi:ribosome structural constituent [Malassezia pachydermatis]|uniref:Mrps8-mitochondrial ribosomal small subunit n=1 Tax=Malassezia pachydermatis TaxID=77020 RepID=A0A0M8MI77_9BASI|nr:mrps8-mitochondrial ribosomal small subunit [Malassezia pachydermatis]KOS12976.1 mrps8-mitochondrial ribosomal small subunit [Malassezia pachydermatis]